MKPHVISHMMSSADGRTNGGRWHQLVPNDLFEKLAARIKVDAWLVGRRTMEEFSSKKPRRKRRGSFHVPKGDFVADYRAKTFAIAIDPHGKCHWESNMVDTEHAIEVLTQSVTAEYLDHLRSMNVSYIFGGRTSLDLGLVLEKLRRLFPIRRLRIDGGGTVNGAFLEAGLIDEFSLVLAPVADGTIGSPTTFDIGPGDSHPPTPLRLEAVRKVGNSVLWVRYKVLKPRGK